MVSLTHQARKKSDATLHLRISSALRSDALRSGMPFALWKVGDLPLLYHWLDHAVNEGYSRVLIYCTDHEVAIRKAIDSATLWPIEIDLIVDRGESEHPGCDLADTLPGEAHLDRPLEEWELMDHWFSLEKCWLERQRLVDEEMSVSSEGIGRWCQIHPSATIHEPVWIGDHVRIGPDSEIGPYVSIGNGCVLNGHNRLKHSKVADHTFMGRHTELDQCYLEGGRLMNRKYRGTVDAVESFIARDLTIKRSRPTWRERWQAWLLLTRIRSRFGFQEVRTLPVREMVGYDGRTILLGEADSLLLQRVPLLKEAVKGRAFLFGVLPRTEAQLGQLPERERNVITQVGIGAFSLADVRGVHDAEDPREGKLALEQALSDRRQIHSECGDYIRKLFIKSRSKDQ